MTPLKSSGLGWADKIPKHWDVAKVCLVARLQSGHTPSRLHPEYWVPSECTIPWVSLGDVWQLREGVREYLAETKEKISPRGMANSAARLLPAGTVVLSRTASVGFSGIMPEPMATTQDFANWICGPRLLPEFLLYAFRGMKDEFQRMMMGSTHQTIYMPDIRRLSIPVPPRDEQSRIVRVLRRRLPRLDALIAKKERLIELLQENRQALITQAVTKGLDPNVPMKESGVEWIGAIPAHWSVGPLRHRWRIVDCKHTTPTYVDEGYPLVSTTEVKPCRLDLSAVKRRVVRADFVEMTAGGRTPRRGDIIYSRNASLGSAAYVDSDEPFCMGQDVVLITSRRQSQLFLAHVLNSPVGMTQVALACIGSTFKRINVSKIGEIDVPIPSYEEQLEIGTKVDEIDRIARERCARVQSSVDLLREYRQALVTAAVTGKLDLSKEPS